jgi:hypothetical protein
VSSRIPESARRALDAGVLCHVAARTAAGPHLTPVVYVFDGGRLWLTTARRSVKAQAWRRDPSVAGMVRHDGLAVVFRGRVRTYDALDVGSWPGAVAATPSIARAAARFSVKNARFFAGYAVDARRVPFAWTPPGRVFASVQLTAGWVLPAADGAPTGHWGDWPLGAAGLTSFHAGERRRGVDLGAPAAVREAATGGSDGVVAFDTGDAQTVLPARARRVGAEGAYDAVLPSDVFELSGFGGRGTAALTLDRASRWRAADMRGMLLRGPAQAYVPGTVRRGSTDLRARIARVVPHADDHETALVRLHPTSVVWWEGWTSGTVRRP